MGGACSVQRHSAFWRQHMQNQNGAMGSFPDEGSGRSSSRRAVRHSVLSEVPDDSIAALYPVDDNYILDTNNSRSPKSLVELCIDALCRSLPYLDGELPPGLPQDVVDDIVNSLMKHAALNATTLRILRNCELGALSLAGCRGVSDEWLEPLGSRSFTSSPQLSHLSHPDDDECVDMMDLGGFNLSRDMDTQMESSQIDRLHYFEVAEASTSSCSTSSFVSASSSPYEMASPNDTEMAEALNALKPRAVSKVQSPPTLPAHDFMAHNSKVESPLFGTSPAITSTLTLLDLRGSQRLTDRGLMQLRDLGALEVVKLDNCHSLVGRGLVALAASRRLHTLSLANCRRLTDEAIINISHLYSMEALSLGGCRCLTDRSLAAISDLVCLRKLDLSQCDLLTDSGLDHLVNLEALEELSLGWCRCITDHGLDLLVQQPMRSSTLRILRLARCPITDQGVAHLSRLVALEELDLNGCSSIGSTALADALGQLGRLTSLDVSYCPGILWTSWQGKINTLKSLELCYSGVKDAHLSRLSNLPNLEELNLDSCPVGDWAVAHLADNNVVPNLTFLGLADTDLSDQGMVHIPKFQKLTRLSLFYCNITNVGLRHLANMTSLEVLNLDSREIGDDGLSHLRNLTNLRSLDIFSGRVTDIGCAHLSMIKSLESLELCGGGIGDLGCTLLASLENLTSLNLSQNERISNRGAAALAALTNLKALNLSNTRVNAGALRFFSGLIKLQSLALYGCRGIEEGSTLDALQNGLPKLKCLRLNSSSDDDGKFNVVHDEDDDSDVEHAVEAAGSFLRGIDDDLSIDTGDENGIHHLDEHSIDEMRSGDDSSDDDTSIYSDHD